MLEQRHPHWSVPPPISQPVPCPTSPPSPSRPSHTGAPSAWPRLAAARGWRGARTPFSRLLSRVAGCRRREGAAAGRDAISGNSGGSAAAKWWRKVARGGPQLLWQTTPRRSCNVDLRPSSLLSLRRSVFRSSLFTIISVRSCHGWPLMMFGL